MDDHPLEAWPVLWLGRAAGGVGGQAGLEDGALVVGVREQELDVFVAHDRSILCAMAPPVRPASDGVAGRPRARMDDRPTMISTSLCARRKTLCCTYGTPC